MQPDAIIFDKTGTLTTGDFQVRAIHWLVPENQADLDRLASIEAGLDHPIARALARVGRVIPVTERDVERTTVQGQFDGQQYRAGKTTLYEDLPEALAAKGLHHVMDGDSASTLVAFGDAQSCHLVVELRDEIRPEIPALLKQIPTAHLCSGDRQPMVEAVADRLGIEHRHWDMSIEDKLATIREMQAEGQTVMMVGDGVNDSQALTAADIGLAVLAGEVPAKFSADGAFLVSDLSGLAAFLDTLGELRKRIAQNYLWSFLYNGIGLTLAVSGLLSPTFCAFGMVFSNTVVVANSVRRLKTTQKPLPLPGAC